jgi:hypothetical protein
MEKKRKTGRPKKNLSSLPKDWENKVINLMSEGASEIEVKAMLSLSNDTFARFLRDEPIFLEAVKRGRALCEAWWQREGRINLRNREFNAVLWYMNMKNRFGWRDKQEVEHSGNKDNPVVIIDAGANPYKTPR